MKMIFLVDGDNNIGTGLQGIDLLTAEDTVLVFFGKGQTLANVKKLCAGTKAQVQYLESVKGGKNSLDFQIITELGVLVGRGEADFAYVISQDKGYEAAMSALHARYASTFREVALRPSIQDCLQAAFLLRAGTREELAAALARQYGPVQGQLAYEHLEALLTPPPVQEAAAPSPAPENKAASKPGKRRSRAAAKSGSICARWRVRQVCIFWAAVCRNLMHRAASITPAFSSPLQARNLHATGNVICLTSHCRADCAYRKAAFLHPASSCGLWNLPSGRSALPSASIFAFRSNSVRLLTAARSWCWFQQRSTRPQDRRIGRSTAAAARWTIRCFSALVRLRLRRMARIPITAIPWR